MAEKLYVKKGVTSDSFYLANEEMHILNGGSTYLVSLREKSRLYVSKGGVAERTAVSSGGRLLVSKGGLAERTTVSSGGYFAIHKGGLAKDVTTLSSGWCYVFSGGSASGVEIAKGGTLYLESGGTATDISWTPCQGRIAYSGGTYSFASRISGVHYGSDNTRLSSWASQVSTKVVLAGGSMCVMHGGTADKMTVASHGSMFVFSGGTATGATVTSGGFAYLNGGVMKDTTLNGGVMFVQRGGIVSGLSATNGGVIYVESGGTVTNCSGNFSLHVYSGGTATMLRASAGDLAVYKGAKVYNVSCSDSVYVEQGKGASIKWNSNLTLLPEPSHDCDDGWNNWVYNTKTKERSRFFPWNSSGVILSSGFQGRIQVDDKKPTATSLYDNYVGYRDDTDFQKLTLTRGARVSFKVTGTGNLKFSLWKLVDLSGYEGSVYVKKYSMKEIQTSALKWNDQLQEYTVETASLQLEKSDTNNEYFISVQAVGAANGASVYYNVELNYSADKNGRSRTYLFSDGDNNDNDWLCTKKTRNNDICFNSTNITQNGAIQVDSVKLSKNINGTTYNNFVGFGDEKDYGRITLNHNGKLSFTVRASDAAKFTVYKVVKKDEKNAVTYTAKSLLSGTLKKKDGVYVYSSTKGLQLLAGESYYVCVQSTNAKKSEFGCYYNVSVEYETMSTVKEGKMADALTWADPGVEALRTAGLDLADRSSGGLDDWASAGAWDSSFLHDDLSFGRLLADSMAAGAASALDSLADSGQSGWRDLVKLA